MALSGCRAGTVKYLSTWRPLQRLGLSMEPFANGLVDRIGRPAEQAVDRIYNFLLPLLTPASGIGFGAAD